MTIGDILADLLVYLDVRDWADVPDESYLRDVLRAFNSAAQEVQTLAGFLSRRSQGALLPAPRIVTIASIAHGDTSATISTGTASMAGCTVLIGDDGTSNEIIGISGNVITLAIPYAGTTGPAQATIYGDCVQLPVSVISVLPYITIGNGKWVRKSTNRQDLWYRAAFLSEPDYGRRSLISLSHTSTGQPRSYFVQSDFSATGYVLRLRVAPLPDKEYSLGFEAMCSQPPVLFSDVNWDDGTMISRSNDWPLPLQWAELYLLPIARHALLSSAYFKNDSAVKGITDQYGAARAALLALRPNKAPVHMRPRL